MSETLQTSALSASFSVHRPGFSLDITIDALPGETIAIMGPSGAGKTTVLGALSGLIPIDAGRIQLGDRVLADREREVHVAPSKRRVSSLGQEGDLFPHMTALQNIAFAARARGVDRETALSEAGQWLERIGLTALTSNRPSELSGGQAKRIALVRALAARPQLLLVDEPLVSLDVEAAQDMRELITAQLQEHPTTTVLVSHDARDAEQLASRLFIVEGGEITQAGSVSEVLDEPATRFVRALARSTGRSTDHSTVETE
ncbi:ABC transporter ATP-binding protein [Leucobacter denitrificans]|uniref:ABC transporter ATP-binding protein n=1 Tax=Leucobacter denitrificans TaxID=683042 RepID=A0A7G9S425_9MICO|nr:ABC transporter ATP-binding protein [Leucobacter denitrificans]QNN62600.1 ABC transporter ATP-binding protein [Leucobacter denitrificans]